jgi:hypothetical protein
LRLAEHLKLKKQDAKSHFLAGALDQDLTDLKSVKNLSTKKAGFAEFQQSPLYKLSAAN